MDPQLGESQGSLTEAGPGRFDAREPHSVAASALRTLLRGVGDPAAIFVLPDGQRIATSKRPPVARVQFTTQSALWKFVLNPDVHFGDGYSDGSIRVEGDLTDLIVEVYRGLRVGHPRVERLRRFIRSLQPASDNTLTGSRDNIHRHYDIGNEFYGLWLGATMAYTCAYYPTCDASLDAAQVAKMDHVCRKLYLRPGETVFEAGCGWGSLALHMAQKYGVNVRAFNISTEQIAYARAQARRLQISDRVEFVQDDYRNIDGRCDAFVSVGMLEHVGLENYPALGKLIARCVGAAGRGLIHSIGRNAPVPLNAWITKRIFPGAYPPAIREMMDIFEAADLAVADVENLRLHYARTLHHWRDNYERAAERVREMFDERFVRAWRLYLAGSEAAFITGDLQLFQVVFAPRANNDVPWTRAHLYR